MGKKCRSTRRAKLTLQRWQELVLIPSQPILPLSHFPAWPFQRNFCGIWKGASPKPDKIAKSELRGLEPFMLGYLKRLKQIMVAKMLFIQSSSASKAESQMLKSMLSFGLKPQIEAGTAPIKVLGSWYCCSSSSLFFWCWWQQSKAKQNGKQWQKQMA